MANETDIRIGIKTTADTAGALAAKKSIEQLIVARKPLEDVRSQFMSAREAEVAEIDRMVASAQAARPQLDGMAASVKKLDAAVDAAGRSNRMMGGSMQNVGYQVADFAVQIEGGTSALRAFSQQGSQILGAFGPWGAVAGAVLAVTAAIFSAKKGMGEAKVEAKDLEDALAELGDAAKEAAEKAAEAAREMADELKSQEVEAAIERQNDALAKGLELLDNQLASVRKRRREEEEVLQAQDKFKLAQIDEQEAKGEITSSQAESARGQVERGAAIREREERKTEAAMQAKMAEEKAKAIDSASVDADRTAAAAAIAENEALRKKAEADASVARRKKEVEDLKKVVGKGVQTAPSYGPHDPTRPARQLEEKAKFEKAQVDLLAATKAQKKAQKEAQKKAESATSAASDREIARKKADENRLAAEVAKAEAERVATESKDTISTVDRKAKIEDSTWEVSQNARNIREEREAKKKADEKAKDEEARKAREAERMRDAQRDLETDIGGIGREAAESTAGLGARGIDPRGFEKLAAKIAQRGDPKGDQLSASAMLDKLSAVIDAIPVSQQTSPDAEKLRQIERKLEKKLADLAEQVRRDKK